MMKPKIRLKTKLVTVSATLKSLSMTIAQVIMAQVIFHRKKL